MSKDELHHFTFSDSTDINHLLDISKLEKLKYNKLDSDTLSAEKRTAEKLKGDFIRIKKVLLKNERPRFQLFAEQKDEAIFSKTNLPNAETSKDNYSNELVKTAATALYGENYNDTQKQLITRVLQESTQRDGLPLFIVLANQLMNLQGWGKLNSNFELQIGKNEDNDGNLTFCLVSGAQYMNITAGETPPEKTATPPESILTIKGEISLTGFSLQTINFETPNTALAEEISNQINRSRTIQQAAKKIDVLIQQADSILESSGHKDDARLLNSWKAQLCSAKSDLLKPKNKLTKDACEKAVVSCYNQIKKSTTSTLETLNNHTHASTLQQAWNKLKCYFKSILPRNIAKHIKTSAAAATKLTFHRSERFFKPFLPKTKDKQAQTVKIYRSQLI